MTTNELRRDLLEYTQYDNILAQIQAGYSVKDYTEEDVISCLEVYEAGFRRAGYEVVRNSIARAWELKEIY